MKFSTRTRYGINAMYELALHAKDGPQTIKAITERQPIPEAYLEQLMASLRRAKLVTSARGAQGGYTLADKPENITVGMMIRALEGEITMVECLGSDDYCDRSGACPTRMVVKRVRDGVNRIVDSITLQDMIDETIQGDDRT